MEYDNFSNSILDCYKCKHELATEYQMAKKLNIRQSRLRNWRKGTCQMDWDIAFLIAEDLGISDHRVVSSLICVKVRHPRVVKVLEDLLT